MMLTDMIAVLFGAALGGSFVVLVLSMLIEITILRWIIKNPMLRYVASAGFIWLGIMAAAYSARHSATALDAQTLIGVTIGAVLVPIMRTRLHRRKERKALQRLSVAKPS